MSDGATDLYTGPIARALGGVDVAWLVAIAVVSPLYYAMARTRGSQRDSSIH